VFPAKGAGLFHERRVTSERVISVAALAAPIRYRPRGEASAGDLTKDYIAKDLE